MWRKMKLSNYKFILIAGIMIALVKVGVYAAFETFTQTSVRAEGMGGAYTGLSDDPLSWLINPAGLSKLDKKSLGFNYSALYPGLVNDSISQGIVGAALPAKNAVYGLTYAQLSSAKYKETMYVFSVSKKYGDYFSLGANIKSMGWSAATLQYFNGTSEALSKRCTGLDIGYNYMITDDLAWGMSAININRPDIGSLAQELLPMNIRTGLWYKRLDDFNVALDMGMEQRRQSFAVGAEKWFKQKKYAVRGGWMNTMDGGNLSAGASYVKGSGEESPVQFDLAFIYPLAMKNLPALRFSTSFLFGKQVQKETASTVGFSKRFADMDSNDFESMQVKEGKEKLEDIVRRILNGELTEVKFEVGTDKIGQGYNTLDLIGQALYDYPKLNLKIEVHTDSLGDPDANLALTYKQGDTLKDYLVKKFGVGAKRIEVIGQGGSRPIVSPNEPGGIERNRRVEFSAQE